MSLFINSNRNQLNNSERGELEKFREEKRLKLQNKNLNNSEREELEKFREEKRLKLQDENLNNKPIDKLYSYIESLQEELSEIFEYKDGNLIACLRIIDTKFPNNKHILEKIKDLKDFLTIINDKDKAIQYIKENKHDFIKLIFDYYGDKNLILNLPFGMKIIGKKHILQQIIEKDPMELRRQNAERRKKEILISIEQNKKNFTIDEYNWIKKVLKEYERYDILSDHLLEYYFSYFSTLYLIPFYIHFGIIPVFQNVYSSLNEDTKENVDFVRSEDGFYILNRSPYAFDGYILPKSKDLNKVKLLKFIFKYKKNSFIIGVRNLIIFLIVLFSMMLLFIFLLRNESNSLSQQCF